MVSSQLIQNNYSTVQVLGMNFQSNSEQNMRESYLPINWQINIFGNWYPNNHFYFGKCGLGFFTNWEFEFLELEKLG